MQAAYEYGRDQGIKRMILTACTGGRQDHHLANLQLLERASGDGVTAEIWDMDNQIFYLKDGVMELDCKNFRYFSIIPIDPVLHGVSIENAKYPLYNVSVNRGDSLTVSNEPVNNLAKLTIKEGSAWIIASERIS